MELRSVRDEIINLNEVTVYSLEDNILIIRDDERIKKYTLTPESKKKLEEYIKSIK